MYLTEEKDQSYYICTNELEIYSYICTNICAAHKLFNWYTIQFYILFQVLMSNFHWNVDWSPLYDVYCFIAQLSATFMASFGFYWLRLSRRMMFNYIWKETTNKHHIKYPIKYSIYQGYWSMWQFLSLVLIKKRKKRNPVLTFFTIDFPRSSDLFLSFQVDFVSKRQKAHKLTWVVPPCLLLPPLAWKRPRVKMNLW